MHITKKVKQARLQVPEIDVYNKNLVLIKDIAKPYQKNGYPFYKTTPKELKEFLYVPNSHYLIYFEDNILLKTKKVNFQYS